MELFGINYMDILRSLVEPILLTIGLWKLLPKCGVKKTKALIPYYRVYKLAQSADMEDAGIILVFSTFAITALSFLAKATGMLENDFTGSWLTMVVVGVMLALVVVVIIYSFRVYWGICKLFDKSGLWIIAWMLASFVPAIIWGFNPKVKAAYDNDENAAPLSGTDVKESREGLTVNLECRTIREGFKKKYLLRDIHFNVKPGRMVMMLGGSGSGKTTLVNAIIGYEPAKARILLNEDNVYTQYDKMKYEIALVPQQDLMRYDDTVLRTLSDAAVLRMPEEIGMRARNKRVQEVLEIFGLEPSKQSEVQKLSGGQKKRLSIAMEYISDPYLFVLDEPDSGLDGVLARDLMTRLKEISRQGKIVIVITHSPDRVLDLFDDVLVLAKDANKTGRLVYFGPIDEAKEFFGTEKMEEVVRMINRKNEGGEGRADELIEKYMEVSNAKKN